MANDGAGIRGRRDGRAAVEPTGGGGHGRHAAGAATGDSTQSKETFFMNTLGTSITVQFMVLCGKKTFMAAPILRPVIMTPMLLWMMGVVLKATVLVNAVVIILYVLSNFNGSNQINRPSTFSRQ